MSGPGESPLKLKGMRHPRAYRFWDRRIGRISPPPAGRDGGGSRQQIKRLAKGCDHIAILPGAPGRAILHRAVEDGVHAPVELIKVHRVEAVL